MVNIAFIKYKKGFINPDSLFTFVICAISDFSKKKSVHSISSLWFIVGLAYIIAIVNISCFIIHYVPELKDAVKLL